MHWVKHTLFWAAAFFVEEMRAFSSSYRAQAKDLKSGRVIYYENHEEIWQEGRHLHSEVTYTTPEGKTIARKKIIFEKSKTAPDFVTEDLRTGYLEGAQYLGPQRIRLFTRESAHSPLKEKVLTFDDTVVVDGGFDYFIRQNWEKLMAGEKLHFLFTVPARLTAFRFRIYKIAEERFLDRDCVRFALEFDNLFLRFFLDGFSLFYDKATRRLVIFRGLTNIPSPSGTNYIAEILFPPLPRKE
ncbi:MAG: hypothetical protein NZM25_04130 [Leptospiraceae bacterium]|nr:hypothetical protein [Leptospiraceae bacterium]MDW8305799.1 hypothetical protein [Leptospiraceae bacterium]